METQESSISQTDKDRLTVLLQNYLTFKRFMELFALIKQNGFSKEMDELYNKLLTINETEKFSVVYQKLEDSQSQTIVWFRQQIRNFNN